MRNFQRFAIYYAPEAGGFADAAAAWLGWDLARGCAVAQPDIAPNLPQQTHDPRKYGFHGTIKPPFRLASGLGLADLELGAKALAARLAPVQMAQLELADLQGFLAFVPVGDAGDAGGLSALAGEVVRELDAYRAPLTAAEIARRRPDRLTDRQRDLLAVYGYPYVMEEFQFHLTLSGALDQGALRSLGALARDHFAGLVPQPFVLRDICLCGEDEAGRFHLIRRFALMAGG